MSACLPILHRVSRALEGSIRRFLPMVASLMIAGAAAVGATATTAHADAIDDFVTRFYSDALDRAPEPDGFAAWNAYVRANCNAAGFGALARAFFGSPEFVQTKRLTPAQLVTKLYATFLARQPDGAGLAAWVTMVRQSRLRVALSGFVPSAEFQSLLPDRTNRAAVTAVVSNLYTEILNRPAEQAGLNAWVDYIVTTQDLEGAARGFLASPEFEARPLTFSEYVTILYHTFLMRAPDPAGLAGWDDVLANDMLAIINGGFVPSAEFQGLSASVCGGAGGIPNIVGTYSGTLNLNVTKCTPATDNGPFVVTMVVGIIGQSAGQYSGNGSVVASINNMPVVIATLTISGTVIASGGIAGSFTLQSNPPGAFTTIGNFGGTVVVKTLNLTVVTQDLPPDTCHGEGTYVGTRP